MKSIRGILNYLIEKADSKVQDKVSYKRYSHKFSEDARVVVARGPNNTAEVTFPIKKENVYEEREAKGRKIKVKKQITTSYKEDIKDWEGKPTTRTRYKKEDVYQSYRLTDQDVAKATALVKGFINKVKPTEVKFLNISRFTSENNEYTHNHSQIEKVIKSVNSSLVSSGEEGYVVKTPDEGYDRVVISLKGGEEETGKSESGPVKKRVPTEFVKSKLNIGVKRVFRIEKDEDGNEIKRYTKLFPKATRYRKLVHTYKRKDGTTIEIYDYNTREGAGYKTWAEKQGEYEKEDMRLARNMDANKAKSLRYQYEELKKEIKAMAAAQIQREITVDKSEFPKEALNLISTTIDTAIGKFSVYTDWGKYTKEEKAEEARKAVGAVKYKYGNLFNKPLGKAPIKGTTLVKSGTKSKAKPKTKEEGTPAKYKGLINILVNRDKITPEEAYKKVVDVRSNVMKYVAQGNYTRAEEAFIKSLKLEADYMYDIL